jgi:hypothetical protein
MMQFTVLVILACDISGRPCREHELTFADVSPLTCVMSALPVIAEWHQRHPTTFPRKWWCKQAGLESKA